MDFEGLLALSRNYLPDQIFVVLLGIICLILFLVASRVKSVASRKLLDIANFERSLEEASFEDQYKTVEQGQLEIKNKIDVGKEHFSSLKKELDDLNDKVEALGYGLRNPVFRHDDPEDLKNRIKEIRQRQFECIKAGIATSAYSNWDWCGSRSDGDKMVKAYSELLLNAFNAEFESIRRSMKHSTGNIAQGKLDRLVEQLDRLGEAVNCEISYGYQRLKGEELSAWHDGLEAREQAKKERREHQKLLREQAKDKAFAEFDKIDKETEYRQSDLIKARKIAAQLVGLEAQQVAEKITRLENELAVLEEQREAAMSQAQKTRAGFIYVISNIGSFGEGIVKIGMTRRLEPMDRVIELGDASVPFRFDVHTLVFTSDAPRIENSLHKKFSDRRVNKENNRKEFFRVSPAEVKDALDELGMTSDWYFDVEAREYRESLLVRATMEEVKDSDERSSLATRYPETI